MFYKNMIYFYINLYKYICILFTYIEKTYQNMIDQIFTKKYLLFELWNASLFSNVFYMLFYVYLL